MSGIFRFFLLLTLSFDVADDLFLVVFFFFCCCGCCCCCCLQLRCHVATQGEGESCKSNAVVCCQSIRVSGGGKKKKKKDFNKREITEGTVVLLLSLINKRWCRGLDRNILTTFEDTLFVTNTHDD